MRRRNVITLLGGAAAAWSLAARAQRKARPVIGFLGIAQTNPFVAAFRQGLSETGYVEGQNVAIEFRWAEGRYDRLPALAADLVGRGVDLIATSGGTSSALVAKSASSTIPIVFVSGDDPVESHLVGSFARPGGNVTGATILTAELHPKRLELLAELVPRASIVALLVNPNGANAASIMRGVREAVRVKGMRLQILKAATDDEIEGAFATLVKMDGGALVVGSDAFFTNRREQLVAQASLHAVPAIYYSREFAEAGGLISYGPSIRAAYRQAGVYSGKILNGVTPADLPVMQPTKFELVINLKTAKALGLAVPQSLLARADEIIE